MFVRKVLFNKYYYSALYEYFLHPLYIFDTFDNVAIKIIFFFQSCHNFFWRSVRRFWMHENPKQTITMLHETGEDKIVWQRFWKFMTVPEADSTLFHSLKLQQGNSLRTIENFPCWTFPTLLLLDFKGILSLVFDEFPAESKKLFCTWRNFSELWTWQHWTLNIILFYKSGSIQRGNLCYVNCTTHVRCHASLFVWKFSVRNISRNNGKYV